MIVTGYRKIFCFFGFGWIDSRLLKTIYYNANTRFF